MASFEDDFEIDQPAAAGGFSEFLDSPTDVPAPDESTSPAAYASPEFSAPAETYAAQESYAAQDTYSPSAFAPPSDAFGENPLAAYRRRHEDYLDEKDQKSEQARRELLAKAAGAIEDFNRTQAGKREKHQAKNRAEEAKFVAERDALLEGSNYTNDWERVAALIDIKAPAIGRDTSRMRKLLIELKH